MDCSPHIMNLFRDFEETLFEVEGIYPLESNDCYSINELCLRIGLNQHIDLDQWSQTSFKQFIDNLKANKDGEFIYFLNQNYKTALKVENQKMILDIIDDLQLCARRTVNIDENIIARLENVYKYVAAHHK